MTKAENKHTNNNVNQQNRCSWEGISYIIKCSISSTNLVNLLLTNSSITRDTVFQTTCSHSETPQTLDSSANMKLKFILLVLLVYNNDTRKCLLSPILASCCKDLNGYNANICCVVPS